MKQKQLFKYSTLLSALIILSGCVDRTADGQPTGWVWDLFGRPIEAAIHWFAQALGSGVGSYAMGIIIVTFLARCIIAPLSLGMSRASFESSEKMTYIKPLLDEMNERLKLATTPQEQMAIRAEQMALQQAAGIKLVSASGCLPIFVQIPIFSALYFAASSSPAVNHDIFFNIPLGQPSILLAALSALFYYVQGLIAQVGMSPEQIQMNKAVLFITPITQMIFGLSVPAGASLYFVVGGVVVCLTTLYTSYVLRPKIKEQVAIEMANNTALKTFATRKDITPTQQSANNANTSLLSQQRNTGKQNK